MLIIVVIFLIVFAIWYSMKEGEIFEALGKLIKKYLPKFLHKPLYECPVCMTPWYGTAIYFLLPYIPMWILVVISAMGLSAVFSKLFPPDKIEISEEEK